VPTARDVVVSAQGVAELLQKMGLPRDRIGQLVEEIKDEAMERQTAGGRSRSPAKRASPQKAAAQKTAAKKAAVKKAAPAAKKTTRGGR
jgi:ParB-like chromosome segregation protein Spo0J